MDSAPLSPAGSRLGAQPWSKASASPPRNRAKERLQVDAEPQASTTEQGSATPSENPSQRRKKAKSACCGDQASQSRSINYGTSFFLIAWIWHLRVLPDLYTLAGRDVMAAIALYPGEVHHFNEQHGLNDLRTSREFAFMGAFTHTIVFMFGLVCATLIRRAVGAFVGGHARPEPVAWAAAAALALWVTAIFHSMSWQFLHFCFESQFAPVFQFAKLFFRESSGSSPFAWASSVSYSTALLLGLAVNVEGQPHPPGRARRPLSSLRSWVSVIGIPFIVWISTLDNVTLPFLEAAPASTEASASQALARGDGKSIAFVIGLLMCCILPTVWAGLQSFALAMSRDEGVPCAGTRAEATRALLESLRAFLVSAAISSAFLTISLYDEANPAGALFAATELCRVFFQPRFLALALASLALVAVLLDLRRRTAASPNAEPSALRSTRRWLRDSVQLAFVTALWNCYLIGWWGSFMPFQIYAYLLRQGGVDYTAGEAAMDGWSFVFCGSYIFPVVFQGALKVFSAKMRVPWGVAQETVVAFVLIVPLSLMLWHYWSNQFNALPVMIGMTIIHLSYLLVTWRDRPELTGWRFWKEVRLLDCWGLIEDYFDQQIIVEGESGRLEAKAPSCQPVAAAPWPRNTSNYDYCRETEGCDPVPRVIGFHPHGLFPCTLVWSHLTPRWRSVFGTLMPRPLADAFIHTIPFMREFTQWAGGLEVSRPVVKGCLARGETVMLVPGGQGEILFHSGENMRLRRVVVCNRHKGFIRVALEHGADLVPAFSFGELQAIQNISCPPLQRFTRRLLGFPLPFFPVGRLGVLPIPNRVKMTLALGERIPARCAVPGNPSDAEIDALHKLYFERLVALFDRNKAQAGFPDWSIALSEDLKNRAADSPR